MQRFIIHTSGRIFIYSLLLVFIADCSASRILNYREDPEYSNINYLGERYSSKIFLTNGTVIECGYFHVESDSVIFNENDNVTLQKLSLNKVHKIEFKDGLITLISSVWIGLITGLAVGLLSSGIINRGPEGSLGAYYLGLAAMPIGFLFGLVFSGYKTYIFNKPENYTRYFPEQSY